MWVLDLNALDAWRKLPDYPISLANAGRFIGWTMLLYNDTALLFTGRPTVDVFDLSSKTWSSFETTYSPTAADISAGVVDGWPYPGKILADATMQIVNDKLYVFGGGHHTTAMGCNLFMELDLKTRKWRRLSGYVRAPRHSDNTCPGPRKSAGSWANPDKDRIFLLFGHFDREGARAGELHKESEVFGYEDFWSWSLTEERWRRERMSGNPPCARTELAYTYVSRLARLKILY